MVMQDQARRLREPLRWGKREKVIVGTVLACVVIVVVGLGIYGLTSGAPPRRDCIEFTFASTLGGATEHACGAQAREVCATPGAFSHVAAEFNAACARAGFPIARR